LTKTKFNLVNRAYEKLSLRFDWLHFIKNQQELELIKTTILNKPQQDIFALCLKYHDSNFVDVSKKYEILKIQHFTLFI
jgi:hypothetical protein